MTAILATAFFASSLTLAYISSQRVATDESLIDPTAVIEEAVEEAADDAEPVLDDSVPALDDGAGDIADNGAEVPSLEEAPIEEDSAGSE